MKTRLHTSFPSNFKVAGSLFFRHDLPACVCSNMNQATQAGLIKSKDTWLVINVEIKPRTVFKVHKHL